MASERFGRYEVLCQIGDGAMGRVYRAWDPLLSRVVAVKAVKSEYLTQATATDYLRRFRREAQAAGSLSHPSIVRIFDVGFDYLVMEHVEGPTLKDLIDLRGPLDPRHVVRLLSPIADAVDAAHRAGVVHRDIKPANVMVQSDGTPKLMDFGIAHLDTSVMTTAGEILGSPSYMSPEQIAGLDVTGSTDVYALAVVAYELLTGQPPFTGTLTQVIYKVMHEAASSPRQWNVALPPRYDAVFARALDKLAQRRYATAAELVEALALLEGDVEIAPLDALDLAPPADALALSAADEPAAEGGTSAPLGAQRRAPTASDSGRGFYAHLETVMSRPGRLAFPRRPAASRRAGLAAFTLVGLAAFSSALLTSAPEETGPAAIPAATVRAMAPASAPPPRTAPPPATRAAFHRPAPAPATDARLTPASLDPARLARAGLTPPRQLSGQTVLPRPRKGERRTGTVTISLVVDAQGVPRDLAVVESAGEALDAAALASVRSWRFEPARKDGVPVSVRWLARQTYELSR